MAKSFGLCCFLILCLLIQSSIQQGLKARSKCMVQKSCGKCMEAGPECGWCRQDLFESQERCDVVDELIKKSCDSLMVENRLSNHKHIEDASPRSAKKNVHSAIQLQPQHTKITLRPNQAYTFPIHFLMAKNYPVDLYFILDLSQSMLDDKNKLAELGNLLSIKMKKITEDFKLGFGSFVDKKTMPYVSTVPAKLKEPCDGCRAPYGFINHLQLTDETSLFKDMVQKVQISGNLDSPEGGFDAIMQAITCGNEIGWRQKSRKMVLFSTDAGFHYAGDGKLGGIITPNDGHCHMQHNEYTESLNQDYPSISQLAHKISEQKVNVIFAVTDNQMNVYRNLSEFIEGSAVGELANDSSNIVDLVQENYDKISGSVEMKVEGNEDISVKFKSKCLGTDYKESNECDDIKVGKNVTFDVTLLAKKCPANKDNWKQNFTISPVGLGEKLLVEVELVCGCDCEDKSQWELNSKHCNNKGKRVCGSCDCNEGSYGSTCECDSSTVVSGDHDKACKSGNSTKVCSGHGQCMCGKCLCDLISPSDPTKRYDRKFCDCNNYNCDYDEGKLCGGIVKGKCECGVCTCNEGYKGHNCGCATSEDGCRASDGSSCNGKGVCVCGKCTCTALNYKGKTCEECPTCPTDCDERRNCVLCMAFKEYSGIDATTCNQTCGHVSVVPSFDVLDNVTSKWNPCRFRDDASGCDVLFKWESESLVIKVLEERVCPEPVNLWFVLMFLIFGIILIGLLLLILWKILVTIHDRREYARFEKEREKAKWDMAQNPIYKQATSTYKNPTYNKVN